MLNVFNTRLKANLPDLREKKGEIGCPAPLLNPMGLTTRVECLHVCGVLFPEWMSKGKFYKDGHKYCPCTVYGSTVAKNTFWDYIDSITV